MNIINSFFAPVEFNIIDSLVAKHEGDKKSIQFLSQSVLNSEYESVFGYFKTPTGTSIRKIFDEKEALNSLNSSSWSKVLDLANVWKFMPQARRDEWNEQIEKNETPEFNYDNVHSTLNFLINSRMTFIAEKVDGIFKNLSKSHVTNTPEGFCKRMIMTNMFDYRTKGYVDDLRDVIGHLMKRGDYIYGTMTKIMNHAYENSGQWIDIDGNAIRIKAFKKETIHLEVHPDIAFELNIILSHLYPTAIPEKNRKPQKEIKNKNKEYRLMNNVLSFGLVQCVSDLRCPPLISYNKLTGWTDNKNSISLPYNDFRKEVEELLIFLGGVRHNRNAAVWYEFDYNIEDTLNTITINGVLPDIKSFQYYPTPESLAQIAVDFSEIEDHHICLEPSAGQGGIAKFLIPENTVCVEVSELNSKILKEKGFNRVYNQDFVKWADKTAERFDRVIMNPPFSEGRAELHVNMAFQLLKPDGILTAILPASFKNKDIIKGKKHEYSEIYSDMFYKTSVSVIIVRIFNR